jgi:tRNA pseudouridine55 synthase
MGRRRKQGQPVHGWLALDKPEGITSTRAVGIVKRMFNAQKTGHAGTLDPLASGVLPIAFGEATKTVPFIMDSRKVYRFTVRWGIQTSTDDAEGEVMVTRSTRPARAEIEEALVGFTGRIMQVPPQYSAIKVAGERAYDLARDGSEFTLAEREVYVDRLEILNIPDKDVCVFEAVCGKGTYVRALARDLGQKLGCMGHITALRREQVGPFFAADTISLVKLEELSHSDRGCDALLSALKPVHVALDDILELPVREADAVRLRNGNSVLLLGRNAPVFEGTAYATLNGVLVALGEVACGEFRPARVFNML